jgi:eukaryotic-like serine/threonine-protein kinase
MIATWKQWEGVCLAGEYGLDEWLGEADGAAFYRTSSSRDHRPAVLKLIPAGTPDTEQQLELWRELRELSHPALLQLLDFGTCPPDGDAGDGFFYAVYEFPEDTLEAALSRAPLTESEKCEIREAAADALLYLHGHGFVHSAIDAGHVVAVGNQIKLSTDTVRRASSDQTMAEDWRKLELLLPRTAIGIAAEQAPATSAPLAELQPSSRFTLPAWAIGSIAAAVVAGGFWFLPKPAPLAPKSSPQSTPRQVAAVKLLPAAPQPQPQIGARLEWRVIAYTYSNRQAATRRAAAITEKWPDSAAEVFQPKSHSPYLVALGSWMTHDDAVRLLKVARGKGLPRDTYIQNYTR